MLVLGVELLTRGVGFPECEDNEGLDRDVVVTLHVLNGLAVQVPLISSRWRLDSLLPETFPISYCMAVVVIASNGAAIRNILGNI